MVNSEKGNRTHWKLYFTIAKWISLSTVNECISGYQPTKTKMTLVIITIYAIGNTKSQWAMVKQYSRLGTGLVLVQIKSDHRLFHGSSALRLWAYTVTRLETLGCGAILWKSHNKKKKQADEMKAFSALFECTCDLLFQMWTFPSQMSVLQIKTSCRLHIVAVFDFAFVIWGNMNTFSIQHLIL